VQKFSSTTSDIVANPGACSLSYHRLVINNGRKEHNENVLINLRDVQSVRGAARRPGLADVPCETGDTTKTVKDVPDIYVLNIKLPRGVDHSIRIYEQEMADRIAKAMVHAVELCGGGSSSQQEPF